MFGRNDEIWTHDPFHPKEVRYQAALRPDMVIIILAYKLFDKQFDRYILAYYL